MIFEANPDYFQGRPSLDRVIVKVIPDATVAFAAMEKGDMDYFPFTGVIGGPPYQLVNRLKQSKHLEVKVFDVVSTQRLFFRNDKPPFNNLKVRQAVAHAINKRFIVEKLLFGYGQVTHSEVLSALQWAHNPHVPQYEYDVARANQLLDEAGYPRGSGGIRFRTRIYGNPGVRVILSEILKEQFKAVGIAAEVVIQEWASYAHAMRLPGIWTGSLRFSACRACRSRAMMQYGITPRRSDQGAKTISSITTRGLMPSSMQSRQRAIKRNEPNSSTSIRTSWPVKSP
jgi:peptide/nickel transport system substrate-binding protein